MDPDPKDQETLLPTGQHEILKIVDQGEVYICLVVVLRRLVELTRLSQLLHMLQNLRTLPVNIHTSKDDI
jgi:hypothetical protein